MANYSPMMEKYLETKEEHKDCILFYRLGDFYEMFFEDAMTASKELELTLTGKNCGQDERAPMCGVPFHSAETYINRLVSKGYKVAICEQVEDPKEVKGLVKREVVRIVTPGTNLNVQELEAGENNYLMCLYGSGEYFGISYIDVTTGEFYGTEVDSLRKLLDELNKVVPSEIICNESFCISGVDLEDLRYRLRVSIYTMEDWYFDQAACERALKEKFQTERLEGIGLSDQPYCMVSSGALLQYLNETQKMTLGHINTLHYYLAEDFMLIDSSSRRNLELTETLREKQKRGSLLWVLDKTKTAMGARYLRSCLEQPLVSRSEILKRLDGISELNKDALNREEIREYLNPIYDLERLIGRVSYKSANPRDLKAFQQSLSMLPHIKFALKDYQKELLTEIYEELDDLQDVCQWIEEAIVEEPPLTVKEGNIIKEGYNEEIDRLRRAKTDGKTWLAQLEEKEREVTGIKNLKIKYNKVFGYYLEVTNSFKNLVPERYMRKQTLTNAERYSTPELKDLEDMILGAEDKLFSLEYDLFTELRDRIAKEVLRIQQTAKAIAKLDMFASLALVAERNHYVRPSINEQGTIEIKNGRHPVVEQMVQGDMFIPNDTLLDNGKNRVSIITGPNMAGKSTYMRQVALIVLMAQIGSFVPADSAKIGIVDRIFTRVGASDDLASGQSTFMVEMTEVANILRNATPSSLLILDEIGRGTATFDGLSIAWAVVEHISDKTLLGAKTLFATHYHELTELEGVLPGVHNYCIAVKEQGDNIVFLRKIVKGGADKSYGIQVAKLAGVPEKVIERAEELVEELVSADITERAREIAAGNKPMVNKSAPDELELHQMSLFDTVQDDSIIEEIRELDVSNLTPIDALNTLYRLQSKIKNRW